MAEIKLGSYGSIASVLTTELNSLASSARAITAALDNTTDLYLFDDLELTVTYGTNPSVGATVDVYLIVALDGTNYEDGASGAPGTPAPVTSLIASFPIKANTSLQRVTIRNVILPPGLFKYLLLNNTGQAMAASGNTFKRRSHSYRTA